MNGTRLLERKAAGWLSLPRSFGSAVLDLLYPRVCAGCGAAVVERRGHFCWDCLAAVEVIKRPFCSLCGDPVDGAVEHEYVCAFCRARKTWFDRARSAARYRGRLKGALRAFKYDACAFLAVDFTNLLLACVRTHYANVRFDDVVGVPLHPRKERERTFNQSKLLARMLASRLKIGFSPRLLRRVRYAQSQTGLKTSQRRQNVRGAFEVHETDWAMGRTLLLVDDVMTTGATANECAKVLKKAGTAGVYVATVARG
ncbi:MAG: ComF family protein [Verrucomicrobiota bacterium]|nr:ComF family protein [Verrucomicrobiota bacterium]